MAALTPTPTLYPPTPAYPTARHGIRAVPLRGGRWRVTRERGEVLGYVELVEELGAARYRGSRMDPRTARFVPLGEFDEPADALDAVRSV